VYLDSSGWLAGFSSPHSALTPRPLSRLLHETQAPHMSPNAASAQPDKQSLQYIIRTGVAGGVAGCVVSALDLYV
jgi:hypothetical protein